MSAICISMPVLRVRMWCVRVRICMYVAQTRQRNSYLNGHITASQYVDSVRTLCTLKRVSGGVGGRISAGAAIDTPTGHPCLFQHVEDKFGVLYGLSTLFGLRAIENPIKVCLYAHICISIYV